MESSSLVFALSAAIAALVGVVGVLAARLLRTTAQAPRAASGSEPEAYLATIRTLASVIDAGDPFTRGRSERVARTCVKLGSKLGMTAEALRDLEYAALLHDIGKSAIHYDILLKAGRLSERETESVRNHPEIGWRILREIPPLHGAAELVLCHHEQPDGKGYPRKLAGDDIPLGSRVIMAVAAYEAMVCDRPYRQGLSTEEAFEELRKCSGRMFDARAVEALIALHKSGALFSGTSDDTSSLFGDAARAADQKLAAARRAGEPEKARFDWALKDD